MGLPVSRELWKDALEIAGAVKQSLPGCSTCIGGQHVTYCAEEVLTTAPQIDFVVRGEGEQTLIELLDSIRTGSKLTAVSGLSFRSKSGLIMRNPERRAVADLDTLPFPARDVLKRLVAAGRRPLLTMTSSRGCFGRCTFCNAQSFFRQGAGKAWRGRSAQLVVDELEELLTAHPDGATEPVVHFYDDEFIGPGSVGRNRAREIAEEIMRRRIKTKFYIFTRADNLVYDGGELLRLLKDAGLVRVFVGIESGIETELRLFRKGTTTEQNVSALRLLREVGVSMPASGFIMFHPYSSFETLRHNALFLREIGHHSLYKPECRADRLSWEWHSESPRW